MKKSIHTPEYALLRSELRAARERAGLSQRALASRLRVPHSWIAKVEVGERRIDLVELCRFLSACNLDAVPFLERLVRAIAKTLPKDRAKGGQAK
jgi:transcriptional regulator with XRE-family HTH domain